METLGLSVLDRIGNRIGDPSFYNPERKIRLLNLIALKSGLKKPFKEKAQAILKNKKIPETCLHELALLERPAAGRHFLWKYKATLRTGDGRSGSSPQGAK
jgi:hypothetical protein